MINNHPLVSIIMTYYNTEEYVSEAISSVIVQTYENWELHVVNDGSSDSSETIAQQFSDPRIFHYSQSNQGVSAARNLALGEINGIYLCFLDADDVLPPEAISSRVDVLNQNKSVDYVDGKVIYTNESLAPSGKVYQPNYHGNPKNQLLRLNEGCLFGNTWMIRIKENIMYRFDESLTHAEDLFFYLSICQQSEGLYEYVDTPILYYRRTGQTAMADLSGLEKGYEGLIRKIKAQRIAQWSQLTWLKLKVTKVMFLSHLYDGKNPLKAIKVLLKFVLI